MDYVSIDLHKKESQIGLDDADRGDPAVRPERDRCRQAARYSARTSSVLTTRSTPRTPRETTSARAFSSDDATVPLR
jgi:hypothetical protein